MKPHLLIVEDELNLARGLRLNFELEGYEVDVASRLTEARASLAARTPSLVLLDLMLPDGDGLELLQEIKAKDPRQPVMLLTARAADEDRIAGLTLGADDYLTKPFNLQELVLRVRGMVKRGDWYRSTEPEEILIGATRLRPAASALERAGTSQVLTDLELRLMLHLWRKRGQWVDRAELLVEVWGYAAETNTRTVDIFVSRLRRMLGDSGSEPRLLLTKRGKGYMLAA